MRQIRTLFTDIFFILLILLLVLISVFSYQRIARFNSVYEWVNHTNQVKLKLEQVMSSLNEAETAQRGFLLTKDSSFLFPYKGTEQKTLQLISGLDSLITDNSQQQANIRTLKRLTALRYERLRYNLHFADKPLIQSYPFLADGNRYMNQIRNKITEMTIIEEENLKRRTDDKNRYATITPLYTLLLSIFAITIVTIVYFRLRSETRLRIRAEDSEAAIHNFFMQVPAMVAILKGTDHRFEFANPPYLELVGKKNIVGKNVRDALPEVGSQEYFELLDKVYRTGETYTGKEMPLQINKGNGQFDSAFINF
ncbi:MAG: uncharacterized protein JWM28_1581, partial [Chitinophagaceae bacterium]|nr:uncharacterized protein [Chitinophagaceae bacterium]